MTTLLLGVDGGGTACRARLCEPSGRVLGEGAGGPANIRFGLEESFAAAREAALQCLAAAGLNGGHLERLVACLGLAGAEEPQLRDAAQRLAHPYRATLVTSDAHVACVGAHGGGDGAVIVVGTGSAGWAIVGGKQHRVGGWGFPVSDEGSGSWLGCEAVRRTLWAHDGRIAATPLLDALARHFAGDPHRIVGWMHDARPRDFASLAPLIVEHAARGDAVGSELMRMAAGHVDAMARRLIACGAPKLALAGGLAPALTPWLGSETRRRQVTPAGDALDGALSLARARAASLP